jgi:prepilin-type N-terminal cleavage/methylation domain-containing protein
MKTKNRNRGFTLIELMIVVAIIGILASLAIPDFMKLVIKAKQSEARSNLGAIYVCQLVYFGSNDTYAGGPEAFELLNWNPESDRVMRYTFVLDEDVREGNPPLAAVPSGTPSTSSSFLVIAAGNLDNDPTIDVMTVDHHRVFSNPMSDANF